MIRNVALEDAGDIADIYNYYIKNTTVTFEEEPVDEEAIRARITSVTEKYFWIVYEAHGRVVAYAYVGEFKSRSAYKNSVEASVYLDKDYRGRGIGSQLYSEIIRRSGEMNFHTILGVITLPNDGSEALHKKFAFKKVAHFKEVGYKFKNWLDVVTWQLILNKKEAL